MPLVEKQRNLHVDRVSLGYTQKSVHLSILLQKIQVLECEYLSRFKRQNHPRQENKILGMN